MTTLSGAAVRISIHIGEDDTWQHTPLYHEIVTRARAAGLAGATVLRGCEGYGSTGLVHTSRLLDLTENLPVLVVIVDTENRIREFLPQLDELITDGTILVDEVEVVRYQGQSPS